MFRMIRFSLELVSISIILIYFILHIEKKKKKDSHNSLISAEVRPDAIDDMRQPSSNTGLHHNPNANTNTYAIPNQNDNENENNNNNNENNENNNSNNNSNSQKNTGIPSIFTERECKTCKIVRPPGTSHCASCDNCVMNFDQ